MRFLKHQARYPRHSIFGQFFYLFRLKQRRDTFVQKVPFPGGGGGGGSSRSFCEDKGGEKVSNGTKENGESNFTRKFLPLLARMEIRTLLRVKRISLILKFKFKNEK